MRLFPNQEYFPKAEEKNHDTLKNSKFLTKTSATSRSEMLKQKSKIKF